MRQRNCFPGFHSLARGQGTPLVLYKPSVKEGPESRPWLVQEVGHDNVGVKPIKPFWDGKDVAFEIYLRQTVACDPDGRCIGLQVQVHVKRVRMAITRKRNGAFILQWHPKPGERRQRCSSKRAALKRGVVRRTRRSVAANNAASVSDCRSDDGWLANLFIQFNCGRAPHLSVRGPFRLAVFLDAELKVAFRIYLPMAVLVATIWIGNDVAEFFCFHYKRIATSARLNKIVVGGCGGGGLLTSALSAGCGGSGFGCGYVVVVVAITLGGGGGYFGGGHFIGFARAAWRSNVVDKLCHVARMNAIYVIIRANAADFVILQTFQVHRHLNSLVVNNNRSVATANTDLQLATYALGRRAIAQEHRRCHGIAVNGNVKVLVDRKRQLLRLDDNVNFSAMLSKRLTTSLHVDGEIAWSARLGKQDAAVIMDLKECSTFAEH